MRRNIYREKMYKEWLIQRLVGGFIILMIILIIVIMNRQFSSEVLLYEGIAKSVPLLRSETIAKLGEIYLKKENEFETEINNIILGKANRKNKRGDEIYYGVNGKRNIDEMINDDYVNGANITYSNNARKEGESNFDDILSVINGIYSQDADRYEEDVIEMFEYLFDISHTYTAESTELYPCEHGCAFCKYYCGDCKIVGTLSNKEGGSGEEVKYYKSDMYMGNDKEYGLMYEPFLIKNESNYMELYELAGDETKNKTTYQYKVINSKFVDSADGGFTSYSIENENDIVLADDEDIFTLIRPEGFCPVCTEGRDTFVGTTRK